ncbi:two-component sensor histidine kinase [Enhygromyxa salina]|uniref:histidine kinase n=1 Tax=Enhygromyxa salina TaxID=215803 RepID=A0A0C1ZD37_9BACT|nr:AAA family ATPase [Enhygromyxa salina]KIG15609.1 two-component sensor histidine kinase [Enhygromyxa salina]
MGVPIDGYSSAKLLRSSRLTRTYAATRADGVEVVAKVFDLDHDDNDARAAYELDRIRRLDLDGVVPAIGLERVDDQLVVLFERVLGSDLDEFCDKQPLALDTFMPIARRLVETVARIHAHHLIHGDIKPANVIIDQDGGGVFLAELGISSLSARDRDFDDPRTLALTLPYLSPEHSGRTRDRLDARSDLYSLGATFYALLTGSPPFGSERGLDLIYAHLAEAPERVRVRQPMLPESLSRVVMKLLEKAPERRYQSAHGLLRDLERVKQLLDSGDGDQVFELGLDDCPGQLRAPRRLHGREREHALLLAQLDHANRQTKPRLILIGGPPGIGKSALASTLEPETLRRRGQVGRGRFELSRQRFPYSGWIQALDGVLEQLLTGSREQLDAWRHRLGARLGRLASVLSELLPNLESVLGELAPAPPSVGARETQNRLQLAVARLLAGLSAVGPLTLILDDLHAADQSSLELLWALLDGSDCGGVLVLGTYRVDQLGAQPRLAGLFDRLQLDTGSAPRFDQLAGRRLELRPVPDQAVVQIIRDLLGVEDLELAAEVTRRTHNNPHFVLQFLEHLTRTGLLAHRGGRWSWDRDALGQAELPSDALEIARARVDGQLDPSCCELLRAAACIGACFDLRSLELTTQRDRGELLPLLSQLVAEGLIVSERHGYRFSHEDLHAVAAAAVPPEARRQIRWRIGKAALDQLDSTPEQIPSSETLYTLVDHLDAGLDIDSLSPGERERVAQLNLEAGQRALAAASHGPALRYLELAATLIADRVGELREWARVSRGLRVGAAGTAHGGLVFEIHYARAEALSLIGEPDAAEAAFNELLDWPLSMGDYGRTLAGRVKLLTLQERSAEAVALAHVGLRRCGYKVSDKPSALVLLLAIGRAWFSLRRRSTESLLSMPSATDPSACAAMEILAATGPAAYVRDPKLFMLLSTHHMKLVLRHGNHTTAPVALAQVALAIATVLRRSHEAARLADTAVAMCDDIDHPDSARAEVIANMVWHLTRPFAGTLAQLDAAYHRNLDFGEFEFASYLASLSLSMNIETGTHLRTVIEVYHRLERDLGNWGSATFKTLVGLNGALAAALAGDLDAGLGQIVNDRRGTPRVLPLDPKSLVEPTQMELYTTTMVRALFHVMMNEHELGLQLFDQIPDYERVMMGSWSVPRAAMGHAVAAAACYPNATPAEQRRLLRVLDRKLALTRRWAANSPENYQHQYEIVAAEYELVRGQFRAGILGLERARDHAKRQFAAYAAALACERMAAHMRANDMPTLARGPLREAWLIYQGWGARAKLRLLEHEQFQTENDGISRRDSAELRAAVSPQALGNVAIDLETVTTALAAISEELDPELLVCKILEAAMTHAGADHGALLVEGENGLALASLGSTGRRVHALSPPLDLDGAEDMLPMTLITLVVRSGKAIVVDDARADARFARDPYVERTGLRSLLCIPLGKRRRSLGALVLENRRRTGRFNEDRLSVLGFVATQAGGALDNANLYRALRRSEVQWRSLVDGAPDLIALLDANGELSFVNRSLPGWVAGRRPILSPNSLEAWTYAIDGALDNARRSALEIALIHNEDDGQLHWYDAHVAPLEIEHERRQVMVIATEITERKLADARRLELEGQLRQQQRLESLGTLASGVAHEINNPVQGILNYAELLVDVRERPAMVEEFAGEISTEAERVATIVRSLLAFSRREATPERVPTSITEVVDGTLSLIQSTVRKHQIELQLEISEGLPQVRCHSQQIQQILMNLVTNARDALHDRWPDGGPEKLLVIRAAAVKRGGRELVRLSVIDRGGGIPDAVRAHIFDPFFTTKGRDQGTGLGLSVSHGIALDHGGELIVESEQGVGTSFHLELPALADVD